MDVFNVTDDFFDDSHGFSPTVALDNAGVDTRFDVETKYWPQGLVGDVLLPDLRAIQQCANSGTRSIPDCMMSVHQDIENNVASDATPLALAEDFLFSGIAMMHPESGTPSAADNAMSVPLPMKRTRAIVVRCPRTRRE